MITPDGTSAALSVIIPAHDEESTLGPCLDTLLPALGVHHEVIVVPNGCSDGTADAARAYPGVVVVEIPEASKVAALNAGDAVASHLPRVYLDADIRVSGAVVRALGAALADGEVLAASPRVRFDTSRSSRPVQAFYRVYEQTPYVRDRLVGLGIYGLSAAGRARFGAFPDLLCDDLYVQRLFDSDERASSPGTFTVSAPRDLGNLVRVRTRIAHGNRGLEEAGGQERFGRTSTGTARALADLVRSRPTILGDVLIYLAVGTLARVRARGTRSGRWQRDLSTRVAAVTP